ncbi:MAG TPA: hypothetical protein VIO38_01460 [Rariglobus sp.]
MTLIGVRKPFEMETCRIPDAKHVSMRQIPGRLKALRKDTHRRRHRHHGGRNLRMHGNIFTRAPSCRIPALHRAA